VKSSGTFNHTFPSAGSFPYFCTVHGSLMTGMVVVNP
jgi:plastocyanin